MSDPILLSRRFAPLFWCQFFSAFSDNFLKNALVFLILFHPDISGDHAGALVTLAAAVFIAPYFFLSALGGELADRFDKRRLIQIAQGDQTRLHPVIHVVVVVSDVVGDGRALGLQRGERPQPQVPPRLAA